MQSVATRASLTYASQTYHSQLDAEAVAYLQTRGVAKETAARYQIGAVREPVSGDEEYAGMLALPYINAGGVCAIRFRGLPGHEGPKYLSKHGAKSHLYSVTSLLTEAPVVAICEGEFDAMTLNQCGIPAVGVPGVNTWQDHWALLFDDFDRIVVVCDGDKAGKDFGARLAGDRLSHLNVSLVHMPADADANSFFLAHGGQALREKVGL